MNVKSENRREHWEEVHEGKEETRLSGYQRTPARSLELIQSAEEEHRTPHDVVQRFPFSRFIRN